MSPRFAEWIAQRSMEDGLRVIMFCTALGAVGWYAILSHWPSKLLKWGKALGIVTGVVTYAGLFAFSVYTFCVWAHLGW